MKLGLLSLGLVSIIALQFKRGRPGQSFETRAPAANGIRQNLDYFVESIYKTGIGIGKLPVKMAVPLLVKYKIKSYIDDLPMDPAIKKRIQQRLARKDFVDAVIPFSWALKEQYMVDKDFAAKNSFQAYVKNQFKLSEGTPGLRHSLFDWGIKDPNASGKSDIPDISLDKNSIARLVELYDVLFLRSSDDNIFTAKKMRPETVNMAVPILQKLLKSFADKMAADSDIRKALDSLMNDRDRLEAVVISAATFLRNLAQKNYHAFASLALRQADLKNWLNSQYQKKDFGELYSYLLYMNRSRRYGVQIVVDGLQGKLLSSLSSGLNFAQGTDKYTDQSGKRFLQQIEADELKWKSEILALKMPVTEIPATSNSFLHGAIKNPELLNDPRYLPNFRKIYNTDYGFVSSQGISTTPTISVRNLPIVKTGADVSGRGGTGIPNFHFVDRGENRAYYFFGNDALLLEEMAKKRGLKTMPQRMARLNSLNCNAQYDEGTRKSMDALMNLIIGEKSRDFGELLCFAELSKRAENEKKLRSMRDTILDNIKGGRDVKWFSTQARTSQLLSELGELTEEGMPEYLLMYIPWPDHFAHFKGPFSDEIISPTGELNRLDYWLGQFGSAYKLAGIDSNTLWSMAGDHGLTPVYFHLSPDKLVFEQLKKEGVDLVVTKISSDEGGPPMITHPYRPPSMKGKDVVIASTAGGNYMIDLFLSQKDSEWAVQPTFDELRHWRTLRGREVDIVEEIRVRLGETLDYMAIRHSHAREGTSTNSAVAIYTTRNGQPVKELLYRNQSRYFYAISDSDLLGLRSHPKYRMLNTEDSVRKRSLISNCLDRAQLDSPDGWCNRREWMELTAMTDRPDSVVQLAHLYDEDRAGTINLFPRDGFGYNTIVPGRHAGEHFHEKDAFVGIWGEPLARRFKDLSSFRRIPIVNGSLAPTIYEYLTGRIPVVGSDGWGFPSILEVIRRDHNFQ